MHCTLDMAVAVNQKRPHQSGGRQRGILYRSDSVFCLCLCVSSRGAAWPRSPWWRRPGWSRASSCCSPSSACSSSWWRWLCPPLSSACASAHTSAWRRSWPAWGLTPVLMPPQPIRLDLPPCYKPIRGRVAQPRLCHWRNTNSFRIWLDYPFGLWECVNVGVIIFHLPSG